MFCRNCGAQLAASAGFCGQCGTAMSRTSAPGIAVAATKDRPAVIAGLDPSIVVSSSWRRLGAYLLDCLLLVVTLLVGWLIWSIIVWRRGQTPAKQLLKMRVVDRKTLTGATGWKMFARELPCKWAVGFVAGATLLGYVLYFWLLWDGERQEIWDKMVDTIVVNDHNELLDPRTSHLAPGYGQPAESAI